MPSIAEPRSLREAVSLVREADGDAKYLGGGSALVLLIRFRMLAPRMLVSLRRLDDVPGWGAIELHEDRLRIGGGVSLDQVARNSEVQRLFPGLAQAAEVVGNTRIRNVATVGGLMAEADYASDPPAVLVSLGAKVHVGDGRERRTIPARDFISDFYTTELEEGEVVTGVSLPVPADPLSSVYLKFCSRSAEDRPCVGVGAAGHFDGDVPRSLNVAIGAVSGAPETFPEVLEEHLGSPLDDDAISAIAAAYAERIDPIEDARGSANYRRTVTRVQVDRALTQLKEVCGR